jgi:hypothetical protein
MEVSSRFGLREKRRQDAGATTKNPAQRKRVPGEKSRDGSRCNGREARPGAQTEVCATKKSLAEGEAQFFTKLIPAE